MINKKLTAVLVGLVTTYSAASVAQSNAYPSSPIKIVVPYQAGGSTDTVVRELAQIVGAKLGQPIIIENKGGAGATMGARELVRARPDGYTLAILPSPVFRLPHIQDAGYDPLKDFEYINMLSGYTLGVAVKADSPYKTWDDFIAAAKAQPEKITYGTASVGSASNVMMEQIAGHYGIKWTHVPYQGETGVIQAVMGDFVNAYAGSSTIVPMVQSGKMRVLVTWGEKRSAIYPGTPTLNELNPAIPPVYAPFGIAAPKGTPKEVVEKLGTVFKEVVESPQFGELLRKYGQEPVYMNSADYAAYAKKAFAEEAEVVKKLGLRGN
jgi:tripartite-type tricarboxylate transporter receptor subunit TctC